MLPYLEMCAQTMSTLPPQLHPSFFSDFVEHFTTVFHLGLPITTKTVTVGNHQFSWEKGKVQCYHPTSPLIFFSFFAYFSAIFRL
jgi:hypothetical protein